MAKKLSETQRNVLNKIGAFGLEGGCLPGGKHAAQLTILRNLKLIEQRGFGKWAVTLTGCEFVGINYSDAIDAAHEVALILNAPASDPIPAKMPLAPLMDADTAPVMETSAIDKGESLDELPVIVNPFKMNDLVIGPHGAGRVTMSIGRTVAIRYDDGSIGACKFDKVTPRIDPRDAEIARLTVRIAELEARLAAIDTAWAKVNTTTTTVYASQDAYERAYRISLEQLFITVEQSRKENK